jgi:hypothetical protein
MRRKETAMLVPSLVIATVALTVPTLAAEQPASRNDERSATRQLITEASGELSTHFRIYDLAADRCVWSIPPIDTVPVKLRAQKLVVRAIHSDGGVFEVVPVDGVSLVDLATQFLADRRVNHLNIHLAADDSYAGRVVRHDNR